MRGSKRSEIVETGVLARLHGTGGDAHTPSSDSSLRLSFALAWVFPPNGSRPLSQPGGLPQLLCPWWIRRLRNRCWRRIRGPSLVVPKAALWCKDRASTYKEDGRGGKCELRPDPR